MEGAFMPYVNVLRILFLILLFVTSDRGPAVAESSLDEGALFAPRSPDDTGWVGKARAAAAKDKMVVQIDFARLRTDVLFQRALNPGLAHQPTRRVVITLLPNMPQMSVVTTTVERSAPGYLRWIGYIEGNPESVVVFTVKEGTDSMQRDATLVGTIIVGTRTFRIRPDQQETHAIIEIDTTKFPPEGPSLHFKRLPGLTAAIARNLLGRHEELSTGPFEVFDPPPLLPSCQIDVLVLYTTEAKNLAPNTGCMVCSTNIYDDISHAIDKVNESYQRSGIYQRLHLLNEPNVSYETCVTVNSGTSCYNETHNLPDDLDNVARAGELTIKPTDSAYPLKVVYDRREKYNADLVALWVKGPFQNGLPAQCGQSYTMFQDSQSGALLPDDTNFLSVVQKGCALDQFSMAHEFGHLGAANHDRGSSQFISDSYYSYGYVLPPPANVMSIMAIPLDPNQSCPANANANGVFCCASNTCSRGIGFWSNPETTLYGGINGVKDMSPPPPPVLAPNTPISESSADDHLILNTSAEYLANYRWPHVMSGVCQGTANLPPVVPAGLRVR
jgi:hypothetical protein